MHHTGLDLIHGGVGVGFGIGVVVRLSPLAVAHFSLVFGAGRMMITTFVAVKAKAGLCARPCRLLGLLHGGRHSPVEPTP